jgi:predicted metal-binding membrane protein
VSAARDAPGSAFGALSRRVNLAAVGVLVALSVVAWVRTIEDARSMSGMVMGLGQIGSLAQGDMGADIFLVMWAVMMAAMMLPTVAPMVLAHLAVTRRRGDGLAPTMVFVAGYLAVWSASGVLPYFAYLSFSRLAADAARSTWLPLLAGSALASAGAYQFTAWKRLCLDECQSPFTFIVTHDFDGGTRGALRAGIRHGMFCLGCCWALMTVLLVVGLMNLAWMVGLFLVVSAEKSWRHGLLLARITGALLIVLGVMVIVEPSLLQRIS